MRLVLTDLVGEQNAERPRHLRRVPDLLVVDVGGRRQRQEDEARGDGDLGEISHHGGLVQATEDHQPLAEELNLTNENVGRLRVPGKLLGQPRVGLKAAKTQTSKNRLTAPPSVAARLLYCRHVTAV